MELAGPDGVAWSAYIEGVPPVRARRWLPQTMLPGRRLRFDSERESRVTATIPAGSPFLPERRLLVLLADATSLPNSDPGTLGLPIMRRSGRARVLATSRAVRSSIRDAAREIWDWSRAGGRMLLRLATGLRGMALIHHR
jgi:hypothetical protein